MVGFSRRVRREVQSVLHWDRRNGTRLLVAGKDDFHFLEIARGAYDSAFGAVVAGQNPQAILELVIHNIVHVADGALREGVSNIPSHAAVPGRIDVQDRKSTRLNSSH